MSEIKVNKITPKQNCTQVTLGDSGDDIVVATGVNLKTAAVKDAAGNIIVSRCGSNITIGSSGAAVALACGATQTGFGRLGTVDWDTTAKTTNFTAVSGTGYFVNTTSGAVTMNLPASPSGGDIVSVKDYAYTFATNNLTVDGNGSPIGGVAGTISPTYNTNGTSKTFVYVDGTKGWLVVNESTDTSKEANPIFTAATGGTITCCGDYKIHTFTSPGTFCVSQVGNSCATPLGGPNVVDYLVVAGGGGGGGGSGGGGGAGGFRESKSGFSGCWSASPLVTPTGITITASPYPISVGGGGPGPGDGGSGGTGSNSIFSTITSGGGGGGRHNTCGAAGGSGGGAGYNGGSGGAGNTPPVSPPQGQSGGTNPGLHYFSGGGGGGAGGAGGNRQPNGQGGNGGQGVTTSFNGSSVTRAGGGGASNGGPSGGPTSAPSGGSGGGGPGRGLPNVNGTAGTVNTGGGGGSGYPNAGAGGSGIVIIRYKFQ